MKTLERCQTLVEVYTLSTNQNSQHLPSFRKKLLSHLVIVFRKNNLFFKSSPQFKGQYLLLSQGQNLCFIKNFILNAFEYDIYSCLQTTKKCFGITCTCVNQEPEFLGKTHVTLNAFVIYVFSVHLMQDVLWNFQILSRNSN